MGGRGRGGFAPAFGAHGAGGERPRRKEFVDGCDALGHEDRGVEFLKMAVAVELQRAGVVLGDFEYDMGAPANAGDVFELFENEGSYALAVVVGVHGEFFDEHRAHVTAGEEALVHPVV